MRQFAFVFTCSPAKPFLSEDLFHQTGAAMELPLEGALNWLAPAIACEIIIEAEADKTRALLASLRNSLGEHPVDVNVVAVGPDRRKSLLIADMDSTIIEQECINELADLAGVGTMIRDITEQAMRGELDFESALRKRVDLLKGLPVAAIERVLNERIHLTSGAINLVQTMKHYGAYCTLVSGGFTAFTSVIAEQAGFDTNQANTLEIVENRLTGHVIDPILGREAKLAALKNMLLALSLKPDQGLAIGDGANDLEMIGYAGLGGAFRAKPIVAAKADVVIEHCDLTGFLYLQGFSINAFYTPTSSPSKTKSCT